MEALQYIYTSWKNGDSTEKGYMIPISFSQQVVVVLHNQLTSEKTTLADTEITLFMR